MANTVAVLVIETELPIDMICADAAIAKGTVLKLTTPFTVAASSAANDIFGGIAAAEKISGDGKLTIPVYRHGIFKCECGTTTTVGLQQVLGPGANELTDFAAGDNELGYVFGVALETATNGEFFLLDLGKH